MTKGGVAKIMGSVVKSWDKAVNLEILAVMDKFESQFEDPPVRLGSRRLKKQSGKRDPSVKYQLNKSW